MRRDRQLRSACLTALSADTTWTEQAHNLLLFGPSGVGKSHMAAAIGYALIEQGQRVRYTSGSALVQEQHDRTK